MACVRTEDGTAIFGYLAKSSGLGGGQTFPSKSIDGYTAVGPEAFFTQEPQSSRALIGLLHIVPLSNKFCVCPDEKFAPNDIYLL